MNQKIKLKKESKNYWMLIHIIKLLQIFFFKLLLRKTLIIIGFYLQKINLKIYLKVKHIINLNAFISLYIFCIWFIKTKINSYKNLIMNK